MFSGSAYPRVPLSSFAPRPSLHMPAMVRLCRRFTIRTTANMLTRATGSGIFKSPVPANGMAHPMTSGQSVWNISPRGLSTRS
jgi:hypothetical protein